MAALFDKLNLGSNHTILVLRAPQAFEAELAKLQAVRILRRATAKTRVRFSIGFAITQKDLDEISRMLSRSAEGDAIVWIAYPKKTSKQYRCEFNRDSGWTLMGEAGFEPVRQVAIDEDWSTLRFRRVENIPSLKRSKAMAISKEGKRRIGT